jgi:hypothetical protein
MPEILLNISKTDARFQQMCGIRMSEMPNRDLLVNADSYLGITEGNLNTGYGDGIIGGRHQIMGASSRSGENPDRVAVHFIEGSQDLKGTFR